LLAYTSESQREYVKKTIKTITIFFTLLLVSHNLFCEDNETNINRLEKAYFELAEVLRSEKQIDESLAYYQKVLHLNPAHLATLLGIGKLYLTHKKEYDKAIEYFQQRLLIDPTCGQTTFFLGEALDKQKKIDEAIIYYENAISHDPTLINAYERLIDALSKKGNTKQAIEICNKALKKNPEKTSILRKLIDFLIKEKKYSQALKKCEILIKLQPANHNMLIKKAQILSLDKNDTEALKIFETLNKKHPKNPGITYNIALLSKNSGKYERAINMYQKALELNPKNRAPLLGLFESYFALGYYKQAFKAIDLYNHRKKNSSQLKEITEIPGKTILIQGEWDTKTTIFFLRYLPLFKKEGARKVIVQAPAHLVPLVQNCNYIDKVLNINKKEIDNFNKYIPISSLPHFFKTTKKNIPSKTPYLKAPENQLTYWNEILQQDKKFKVGIYTPKASGIPLRSLMTVANREQVSAYILHKGNTKDYLHNISNDKLVHTFGKGFSEKSEDLEHLTAIMQNMDLIITHDCLIAHLAGAMNLPVWNLLPKTTSWQWMKQRSDSPWYPSMRLFRQKETGNWDDVVTEVLTAFDTLLTVTAE